MNSKIFINLPSKDLKATATFYARLGFSFDPQFSDDKAKCLIISDDIYFMFLTEQFFKSFTDKDIPDNSETAGAIFALDAESREEVDNFMEKCISAGGRDVSKPQQVDFMYTRSFTDPDGHLFEIFYMDMAKVRIEPDLQPRL